MKPPFEPAQPAAASRVFTASDQALFARLSGDCNPLHMDPLAARRLLSGKQVVHGIHTLLSTLEAWENAAGLVVGAMECEFVQPVSVGDKVRLGARDDSAGAEFSASVGELLCTAVRISGSTEGEGLQSAAFEPGAARHLSRPEAPLASAPETWLNERHRFALGPAGLETQFPRACKHLGAHRLRALAALSYLVGMVCPGLNSIFSSLRLLAPTQQNAACEEIVFEVTRYDSRFRLMVVALHGAVSGELRAFVRPPPQDQPAMEVLAADAEPHALSGRCSLVIGGSRGLGEVTAKLIAARGGDVIITYATGVDDAARVAADIASVGRGGCRTERLVLGSDDIGELLGRCGPIDAVYYYATPKIFRKTALTFERALFDEFIDCYVDQFAQLCTQIEVAATDRPVRVFLPSTTAVTERPRGMTEYAMAKAAAELLAADLNRVLRHVTVLCERLPRLATDQTSTLVTVRTGSNVEVLLPIVQRMMASP